MRREPLMWCENLACAQNLGHRRSIVCCSTATMAGRKTSRPLRHRASCGSACTIFSLSYWAPRPLRIIFLSRKHHRTMCDDLSRVRVASSFSGATHAAIRLQRRRAWASRETWAINNHFRRRPAPALAHGFLRRLKHSVPPRTAPVDGCARPAILVGDQFPWLRARVRPRWPCREGIEIRGADAVRSEVQRACRASSAAAPHPRLRRHRATAPADVAGPRAARVCSCARANWAGLTARRNSAANLPDAQPPHRQRRVRTDFFFPQR